MFDNLVIFFVFIDKTTFQFIRKLIKLLTFMGYHQFQQKLDFNLMNVLS